MSPEITLAAEEIAALVAPGETFILVDDQHLGGGDFVAQRHAVPFLERDGLYWGSPPSDEIAVWELERLQQAGADFIVFAWPAFWWLDHYPGLSRHLNGKFRCLLKNERLVVFDLRKSDRADEVSRARNLARPNDAAAWEEIRYAPFEPVTRLSSPVARAVADLTEAGDVLLEAGCGSGKHSMELATAGRVIELCDFSSRILDRAAELFALSRMPSPRRTLCDLTKQLPWADGAVDVTWSSGVLEHWTDDELLPIVREMARISRKCVISLVPSARCLLYRLGKHLAEAKGRWPYGRELPRGSLRSVFENAGLFRVREYSIWPEWGPKLLGATDRAFQIFVEKWWASLPEGDAVKADQGYLLLTVGYVKSEA